MATTLSRSYTHLATEFYKGADSEGPYYEVVYKFNNWADSDNIPNEMMGLVSRSGFTTTRTTPHQHPLSPNLYCRSARVEGLGHAVLNANGFPDYDAGFLVRAVYRASTIQGVIQLSDDPFFYQQIDPATPILWATQELDHDVDVVTIPNSQSKWASDGTYTGLPCKITLGVTVLRITFYKLPYMPVPAIRAKRGRVNLGTFLGAAEGTVLFLGGRTTRDVATDGTITQNVTLTFKERDQPWYGSVRPDGGGWDTVNDPAGNPIFAKTDLSPLLQF